MIQLESHVIFFILFLHILLDFFQALMLSFVPEEYGKILSDTQELPIQQENNKDDDISLNN